MYKIIGADQKEYGPVSAELLRQWIAEGRANAATLVRLEGAADWKPLGTFPEFFAAPPPPSAPPSIPPLSTMVIRPPATQTTNSMATAGFVLGLLSVVSIFCCFTTVITAPLGIIFSSIALSQINKDPMQRGKGLAIAGLVLSIIGLLSIVGWFGIGSLPHIMRGGHYRWS